MEPDVPGLLFGHHSAFLFDVAERCIGPKAENNDSTGRADGHSRKNIFFGLIASKTNSLCSSSSSL